MNYIPVNSDTRASSIAMVWISRVPEPIAARVLTAALSHVPSLNRRPEPPMTGSVGAAAMSETHEYHAVHKESRIYNGRAQFPL